MYYALIHTNWQRPGGPQGAVKASTVTRLDRELGDNYDNDDDGKGDYDHDNRRERVG